MNNNELIKSQQTTNHYNNNQKPPTINTTRPVQQQPTIDNGELKHQHQPLQQQPTSRTLNNGNQEWQVKATPITINFKKHTTNMSPNK